MYVLFCRVSALWRRCVFVVFVSPLAAAAADADGFVDEFETLDRERWYVSSGWANGPHQSCLWHGDRVEVGDGTLFITLTDDAKDDRDYSCGEIQSNARFGHGIYEARMKVPFLSGINANFFTHIGAPQDRPHNEIDFEFIWRNGPVLQTNYFFNDTGGREQIHPVPDAGDRFHDYAVIWEPDSVRWYIDGTLIREERGPTIPQEEQKIYFSIWSTDQLTDWLGTFEYPGEPLTLEIDWFAYTPLGVPCLFEGSRACTD